MQQHTSLSVSRVRFLQVRWVLVLSASYLVWFSEGAAETWWLAAAYIAIYLASTPLLHARYRHAERPSRWETGMVVFDLFMIAVGLVLSGSVEFFPIVFLVLFLAAVSLDLRAAVGAAVLLGLIHLARLASVHGASLWLHPEHLLRVPFLLAAALFFGFVCQRQRRQARRRQARLRQRARSEALAAAAHDLRSPLANVATFLEMLLAGDAGELSAEQRELVERAHNDIWRVLHRANNLLDVARLDAGLFALDRSTNDLRAVLEEATRSLESIARLREVTIRIDDQRQTRTAWVDAFQMGRVLANLVDNAIRHSPRGSEVCVRLWNPEPGSVSVEVRDQGPGLSPEEQAKLFVRGGRAKVKRGPLSSGLGLYIARGLTEAHDGSITVDSEVGRGTSITVTVPTGEPTFARASLAGVSKPALAGPH